MANKSPQPVHLAMHSTVDLLLCQPPERTGGYISFTFDAKRVTCSRCLTLWKVRSSRSEGEA